MKRIVPILLGGALFIARVWAEDANTPVVLTLADAQNIALKNHPQIAAANYRALAAAEAFKESRAGFFPAVNLVGDVVDASQEGTRILAGGLNNPSIYDRAAAGLQASQLITDFGHTANLAASSKFQAQAADQDAGATREQVFLQVDVGYFSALEAQAVRQVAQQTFDTRQLLLDQVTVLSSNKLKSGLDVSFARVAVQEAKLMLQKARNNSDAQMTSLSAALGYREPRQFVLSDLSPPAPSGTNDVSQLVELALAHRPELLSLRDERESALRFARAQRDARLPALQAIGVIGDAPFHDSHLSENYAAGGLQLSLPLFAGGLYTARQHAAELKAEADAELLRAAEDNIVRDVHLAWLNVNDALEQLITTGQLASSAAEAYELAGARYKIGSSSIVELSQAQLSLASAQIADTNARYNVLIQQANLNYQVGALR
jgi:outer membrane protein